MPLLGYVHATVLLLPVLFLSGMSSEYECVFGNPLCVLQTT